MILFLKTAKRTDSFFVLEWFATALFAAVSLGHGLCSTEDSHSHRS
jgi:hypothetical protein